MKEPTKLIRRSYNTEFALSKEYVNRLEEEQAGYYRRATKGVTPRDHADLKPLARDYADTEYRHANAREQLYAQSPLMYGTADSKREHHEYISDHYGYADKAEGQYAQHSKFAMPYHDGYPGSDPPEGYYSTRQGRGQPFQIREPVGKKSQKERKRERRGL
ncbi:MAG: hypothetical protein Q9200_002959 [Gallowayella weberi]